MRLSMLVLLAFTVVLGGLSTARADAQGFGASASVSDASDQPGATLDINIDVNKGAGGGAQWYANPLWIAIGGLGLLVVVALLVMAGRGGGTTIVKG